jgi:hypothetical protein
MRVELYPTIDNKIMEFAYQLNISSTELVNSILDNVNIIIKNDLIKENIVNDLESNSGKVKKAKKK